jgi:hypothetical protein
MQRLAVGLETAVYGWMGLVANRAASDSHDDDPLASPLSLAAPAAGTPGDALSQAS